MNVKVTKVATLLSWFMVDRGVVEQNKQVARNEVAGSMDMHSFCLKTHGIINNEWVVSTLQ